jgi:exodeoxyribonuclease VII small subunit
MKAMEKNGATVSESLSFEDALAELENVAGTLESGGVGLEDSLRLLQRGMALISRCEKELAGAEAVLEQLVLNGEGELETVRLDGEDEE